MMSMLYGIVLTATVSCVNRDYDFSNGVDMEMALFKNVALPVGSVQKICLKDFLLGEDEDFLEVTPDGNYVLKFADGNVREQVTVPSYVYDAFTRTAEITLPSGGIHISSSGETYGAADLGTMRFDFGLHSDRLPGEIAGISRCDVAAELTLTLSSSAAGGTVCLTEGSSLMLPDFLILGDSVPQGLKKTGSNTLVFSEDIPLSPSAEFRLNLIALDFSVLPAGQGVVSPGRLEIDSEVLLTGGIRCRLASLDSDIVIRGILQTGQMNFLRAEASLDMETAVSLSPFQISGVPDFLKNDGAVIDLRGLRLDMSIDNSFPSGGTISAGIRTFENSSAVADAFIGPVHFSASDRSAFSFSQSGTDAPEGYSGVQTYNFDRLVRLIPDSAELYGFNAVSDKAPVTVEFGHPYYMDVAYSLRCPLCFGNGMDISFTQDIERLDVDMSDFSLNAVQLSFDVINSIPMDFDISAVATDASGEEIPDIAVGIDGKISAGSLASPVKSGLALRLTSDSGSVSFSGLRLSMRAVSGNTADRLIPLNREQGLEVSDIVLRLPEGITLDLD